MPDAAAVKALAFQGARLYNPHGLQRMTAALARAYYGLARFGVYGDSEVLGAYSDDSNIPTDAVADVNSTAGRLRTAYANYFRSTEAGFIAANDSRVALSDTGNVTQTVGAAINTVRTTNVTALGGSLPLPAAATITYTTPVCRYIEILYMDSNTNTAAGGVGANTGTFSYEVDSGGATTTTADNDFPINYKNILVDASSSAAHTLVLTGVSGTTYQIGINYYGANGVLVQRLGQSGATAFDLTGEGFQTNYSLGGPNRIRGFFAPTGAPAAYTCVITVDSRIVTTASTTGIKVGQPIGANAQIPARCYVVSVDSTTQFTMSAPATGSNAARPLTIGAGTTNTLDALILWVGHNDWLQQNSLVRYIDPDNFQAQCQSLINAQSASGGCTLLLGSPKSNANNPTNYRFVDRALWQRQIRLAEENEHCASLQFNEAWGTFADSVALGYQSVASGVHALKLGQAAQGNLLAIATLQAAIAPSLRG